MRKIADQPTIPTGRECGECGTDQPTLGGGQKKRRVPSKEALPEAPCRRGSHQAAFAAWAPLFHAQAHGRTRFAGTQSKKLKLPSDVKSIRAENLDLGAVKPGFRYRTVQGGIIFLACAPVATPTDRPTSDDPECVQSNTTDRPTSWL